MSCSKISIIKRSADSKACRTESSVWVNGAAPPPNSALTTLGAELRVTPALALLAKFDGEFGKGSQTYAGSGTVRYTW